MGLLRVGLALAIVTAAGLWYGVEGRVIAGLWFRDLGSSGRAAEEDLALQLKIGRREYKQMAERRQAALQSGGVGDEGDKLAVGTLRFHKQRLAAVVRLYEGPIDRLQENRWSFYIEVQDDSALFDMRAFSAQPIDLDSFLSEWWFAHSMREAGLLSDRCALVRLSVNGDDWGLYLLREALAEEWLASQGRDGGVIVGLDERSFWERQAQLGEGWVAGQTLLVDPLSSPPEQPAFAPMDETQVVQLGESLDDDGGADAALERLRAFLGGRVDISQAFDTALLGRYVAHANLWGARYGLIGPRAWYYDPSTGLLEPIAHDAQPLAPAYASWMDLAQYEDPAVMEAYAREVARISQPGYVAALRAAYEAELGQGIRGEDALWEVVAERQALLADALHPPETVRAYQAHSESRSSLEIEVGNLVPYPVVLQQLVVGDRVLEIEPGWVVDSPKLVHAKAAGAVVLRGLQATVPRYLVLRVSGLAPDAPPVQVVTQLVGMEEQVAVDVLRGSPLAHAPNVPSVEAALAQHPFLERSEQHGFLTLKAGTWPVSGDLVLPSGVGLEATQPVTLTFEPEAMLFATGPLRLHGPDGAGIHLAPQQESWAGLFVYRTGPKALSVLHNVEIRGVRGVRLRDGSGGAGATFDESPVVLDHCQLADSLAADGLRLVRTHFEIAHTEFVGLSGDAVDVDRAQGRIEYGTFHDALGNGLDVSRGRVDVQESRFVRVHDCAISACNRSWVTVRDAHVADVGLALVSSDLSHLEASSVQVEQVWTAGLAAYRREQAYGQASLQVTQLVADEMPILALVQPGNDALLDGVAVEPNVFDVAALHWRDQGLSGVRVTNDRFGHEIRLLGYALNVSEVQVGGPARLVLYWQALSEIDREYTVFVHALDPLGQIVAQWDAMPRANEYPTTHWLVGRVVDDTHLLALPPGLAAGGYRLAIGLYNWQTGERLPIEQLDGTRVPDARLILEPPIEID